MPILFIHGLFPAMCDPPADWICPDLPGYGANFAESPTLSTAVEYLHELITEPVHLVGHSIGGAIAVLLAAKYPECAASLISVEGNFTLKDAFWSARLAEMTAAEAFIEVTMQRTDPSQWLVNAGVPVTPKSLAVAKRSLAVDSSTIHSMAQSVVEITSQPAYLDQVRRVLESRIPFHLIAGEHSRAAWDVPDFVLDRAASFQIQPNAGHMMMMNDRHAFVELVTATILMA